MFVYNSDININTNIYFINGQVYNILETSHTINYIVYKQI